MGFGIRPKVSTSVRDKRAVHVSLKSASKQSPSRSPGISGGRASTKQTVLKSKSSQQQRPTIRSQKSRSPRARASRSRSGKSGVSSRSPRARRVRAKQATASTRVDQGTSTHHLTRLAQQRTQGTLTKSKRYNEMATSTTELQKIDRMSHVPEQSASSPLVSKQVRSAAPLRETGDIRTDQS